MTTDDHPDLKLIGERETVSYVADPSMGHGRFRLENRRAGPVTASVKSAWLEFKGHRRPLHGITVFDLDQERTLNPESFKVDAGAVVKFLVGFPRVAYEPRFGESTAVGLRLQANGVELHAQSPIEFVRRIPYGFR